VSSGCHNKAGQRGKEIAAALKPNTGSNIEVAKSPIFNRDASKVLEFIIAYRLYIRMRMKDISVEEQIQ